jgi:hypothetical protein|tara:strand:- start:3485 stop:3865 length:381 start_codon:yes stop_codon:yes gene_type:complete
MEKLKKYLENPLVLMGGIGLIVFAYMKWSESRNTPLIANKVETPKEEDAKEEVKEDVKEEVKEESTSRFDGLPKDFFNDVKKMSGEELKHTIKLNKGLSKRKTLSEQEVGQIKLMLDYLSKEYAKR